MAVHTFVPQRWHNVLAALPPELRVTSGDTVITRTVDAAGVDGDGVARASGPNPMNGPIFVTGAEVGDSLAVDIIRMTPIRSQGWTGRRWPATSSTPNECATCRRATGPTGSSMPRPAPCVSPSP